VLDRTDPVGRKYSFIMDLFNFRYDQQKRTLSVEERENRKVPPSLVTFLRQYAQLDTEDGNECCLRIFREICSKVYYYKAQREDHVEINEEYLSHATVETCQYDDPNMKAVHVLVHPNIAAVQMRPSFNSTLGFPVLNPRPTFFRLLAQDWSGKMSQFYGDLPKCDCSNLDFSKWPHDPLNEPFSTHTRPCQLTYGERVRLNEPQYVLYSAFVSGGTTAGVAESLCNITLNTMRPKHPDIQQFSKDFLVSLAHTYRVASKPRVLECNNFINTTSLLEFDPTKNAGYFNVRSSRFVNFQDEVVRLANSTPQGKAHSYTIRKVAELAKKIRSTLTRSKCQYERSWFPTLVAKIAVKPEVRDPGTSATKTRIFFIMCMIKLMIDKESYGPAMHEFYGKGHCGIGHSWSGGGATTLAEYFGAWDPSKGFFCSDVKKLDQSLHPSMLTMIFTALLVFYSKRHKLDYDVLRAFIVYSADDIAATFVKWLGSDYRIVIGVMFSGLFGTSWGDTTSVDLAIQTAVIDFYRKNNVPWETPGPRYKVYGDNILMSWDSKLLIDFVGRDNHSNYPLYTFLHDVYGMTLKLDETSYHDRFFTEVLTMKNGRSVFTTVTYWGPVYLKRRFIKHPYDPLAAMGFRPSSEFYARAMTTNRTYDNNLSWVARWCGLLLDTMGTNPEASGFLRYLIRAYTTAVARGDYDDTILEALEYDPKYWNERLKKFGAKPDGWSGMLRSDLDLVKFFTRD